MEIKCSQPGCTRVMQAETVYKMSPSDWSDVFNRGPLCKQHFKGAIVEAEEWILKRYMEVLLEARLAPSLILYDALKNEHHDSLRWRVIAHAMLEDAMLIEETMLMICKAILNYESQRKRLLKKGKNPNDKDNPADPLFWTIVHTDFRRDDVEELALQITDIDQFMNSLGFSITQEMRESLPAVYINDIEHAIETIKRGLSTAMHNRNLVDLNSKRLSGSWHSHIHPPNDIFVTVLDKMRHGYIAINLPNQLQFYDTQKLSPGEKTTNTIPSDGYLMTPVGWNIKNIDGYPNHLKNQSQACNHLVRLYMAFRYGDLATYPGCQAKSSLADLD